ncbi:uncharacterized protein LOC105690098 isoform X2 [Athalia rosae]|uniref:uncharacterized protein LOC105690098 isoform X2 n=1 Tax=Athalia rosae TaxID=37344 RepID=UPI0020336D33|nr:uncharacterized protein LOC105690098 isoform X2 [Athalia rosae]
MIGDMDDFNFYLKFAKPLVLNLPDAKDRIIAALWVKKLREMQSDGPEADLRIEYLKLLLFVMQRNKLTGIFEKQPPEGALPSFPPNYKATDMLSLVKPDKSSPPVYPPVFTSVGGDLCQFVAVQEIPNFGLHGYYAISIEPLPKWSHASTNAARKGSMKPQHFADCFKDSCKFADPNRCPKKSDDQTPETTSQPKADENGDDRNEPNDCEKLPPGKSTQCIPLPPIPYRTYRKEIAGFESRPTWGRSRYIERLIDESPHLVADLDVSQADAMLHGIRGKTFKKAEDYGPCAISESRRHVERMLDLPPCAVDPGEVKPPRGPFYTCCPKRQQFIETHTDICHNERDFYPCGKRSGLSLRGGSDSGSCCDPQNLNNRSRTSSDSRNTDMSFRQYRPEFSSFDPRNHISRNGPIFDDTDDTLDVDTSIHDATTTSKYIDPNKSGNFKWLEDMEHVTFSDPTEMSFENLNSRARAMPAFSDVMTNDTEACSEFDYEPLIDEELHPEQLMPQVARRMRSSNIQPNLRRCPSPSPQPPSCFAKDSSYRAGNSGERGMQRSRHDNEDAEPSVAVIRRRFEKSREATSRSPEVHEKTRRWKEIIDHTQPHRERSQCSKVAQRMQSAGIDPGYLDYIESLKSEYDDEDLEPPCYPSRSPRQVPDEEAARYTKKLISPPKQPPSSGRVIVPYSKQNRKRDNSQAQNMEYRPNSPAAEEVTTDVTDVTNERK